MTSLYKKSTFLIILTSFEVQAVHLEEKVRKGAYAHFKNNWGFLK